MKLTPKNKGRLEIIVLIVLTMITIYLDSGIFVNKNKSFYALEERNSFSQGDCVQVTLTGVLSNYAETKYSINLIPIGTDEHYIVLLSNGKTISICTSDADMKKKLEMRCEETIKYINEGKDLSNLDSIKLNGKILDITSKIKDYYLKDLEHLELNNDAYYMEIDINEYRFKGSFMMVFFSLLTIISVVKYAIDYRYEK